MHVHGRAIVKDAEMQRRDAVRFASSFSRLLTAYILRTMLSEGKRIPDPVSPARIGCGDGDEPRDRALCTSGAYYHSMRNYIQLLPDKPSWQFSESAALVTTLLADQDETRAKETTEGEGDGRRVRETL